SSPLTAAAAPLTWARAQMWSRSRRVPEIGKFSTARWVWARQRAWAGTRTSPMVSYSMRKSASSLMRGRLAAGARRGTGQVDRVLLGPAGQVDRVGHVLDVAEARPQRRLEIGRRGGGPDREPPAGPEDPGALGQRRRAVYGRVGLVDQAAGPVVDVEQDGVQGVVAGSGQDVANVRDPQLHPRVGDDVRSVRDGAVGH